MKRWLVCPYFNEVEIFEIKLGELGDWADVIVIAEGDRTYAGAPRSYDFPQSLDRLGPWAEKIRYVPIELPLIPGKEGIMASQAFQSAPNAAWEREAMLRNAPLTAMMDLEDEDVVFLSDCDEIVRAEVLEEQEANVDAGTIRFDLPQYVMHLNWRWTWEPQAVARLTTGYQINNHGIHAVARDMSLHQPALNGSLGWHFAYMGGRERIHHKIKEAAHLELARYATWDNVGRCYVTGEDLFARGDLYQCISVPLEELPEYVGQNSERFDWMFGDELGVAV